MIAKAWEEQAAAVKELSLTYFFFVRAADLKRDEGKPTADVPPFDKELDRPPVQRLEARVYQKSGSKESLQCWQIAQGAVVGWNHAGYDGGKGFYFTQDAADARLQSLQRMDTLPGTFKTSCPQIPCVLLDQDLQRALDALKRDAVTVAARARTNGADAIVVTIDEGHAAHDQTRRVELLLDPSRGFSPYEYRHFIGDRVVALRRWDNFVEVRTGVWLPLEYEGYLAPPDFQKIIARNRAVIVGYVVNGAMPTTVYQAPNEAHEPKASR